ncbi:MAG: hypothetical protein LWX52_17140 [Deltaproteobacteria bacterium]|jgi:hypothetical protein|nr:hypothetical protein [Deltaproteobacteria bacterium]
MSQHLNPLAYGKAAGGQPGVRTTFGKSDRVGLQPPCPTHFDEPIHPA